MKKPPLDKKQINQGKPMAILAYILAPIPYFVEKDNKFVRYHAIQGINIFIIAVALWVIQAIVLGIIGALTAGTCYLFAGPGCTFGIYSIVSTLFSLVGLGILILDLIGLVYAAQGRTEPIPFLNKFKIIKK